METYTLPELPYDYSALEPFISHEQLTLHHQKHHQAYVNGANKILEKLEKARKESAELDQKTLLKELSFNVGGHILHSLFWENLAPQDKTCAPGEGLAKIIDDNFGSLDQFQKEFTQTAISVEGSGWATLVIESKSQKPLLMQIEKHNNFIYPNCQIVMVLDVWEHAYYLDYKNERAKFVQSFWSICNWTQVEKRLSGV